MEVLVIDVGGSSVKLWHTGHEEHRKFESGKTMTPDEMVASTKEHTADWTFEAVALGVPARVRANKVVEDPHNLGPGWVGYNFTSALGSPVRILNDASLQGLGSYDGGRMLFLGLGTGVGSAIIAERLILPLDLGRIPYNGEKAFEVLGDKGFEKVGLKKWSKAVNELVPALQHALMADYVVLGGGNVKELESLPDGVRRGNNRAVVEGGRRLWEELPDPAGAAEAGWVIL
jgi:hypothetical protein